MQSVNMHQLYLRSNFMGDMNIKEIQHLINVYSTLYKTNTGITNSDISLNLWKSNIAS